MRSGGKCSGVGKESPLDAHIKFHLAESFAMLGDMDRTLEVLEQAVDNGFYPYPFVSEHCPFVVPLRETVRFAEILAKAQERTEAFNVLESPNASSTPTPLHRHELR